jgi:hypothetical protein
MQEFRMSKMYSHEHQRLYLSSVLIIYSYSTKICRASLKEATVECLT